MASMTKGAIYVSYIQSLLWLAPFIAVTGGVTFIVGIFFSESVHGNTHGPLAIALSTMVHFDFWLFLGVIAVFGTFLIFALPQLFQAVLIGVLAPVFGDRARFAVLLALPLTAVLSWFCYDYLTPSNVCLGGCEELYEHGFSLSRYVRTTLAVQIPITLFSFLYLDADLRGVSRVPVLLGALAVTIVAGGFWGYVKALGQYPFL
jgi:hypothetical protein